MAACCCNAARHLTSTGREKGSVQSMAKMHWDERAVGAVLQHLFLVGRIGSLMSDVSVCIFFHLGGSLIEVFLGEMKFLSVP